MGFDFGYKTGDPGCFQEVASPFSNDPPSLSLTERRNCPNWDCSLPGDAMYSVTCRNPEGQQFKEADISANVDMFIFVKARGGYIYEYTAGEKMTVFTPGDKAISHIGKHYDDIGAAMCMMNLVYSLHPFILQPKK